MSTGATTPDNTAALARRVDPTQTTTLRERKLKPKFTKRYGALRGAVRKTIDHNDALRLSTKHPSRLAYTQIAALDRDDVEPQTSFRGADVAAVEEAFRRWFARSARQAVLEPLPETDIRNGRHYTAPYIRQAYRSGIRDAATQARQAGYDAPPSGSDGVYAAVSAVVLAALYLRTYRAISGTVEETIRTVARVLDDQYPYSTKRQLADDLVDRIEKTGERNAIRAAHAEPVYAYAEGQLDQYERLQIEDIGIHPEAQIGVETANDLDVCDRCRSIAARGPFSREEIRRNRDLHPSFHPHCRCRLTIARRAP